MEVVARKLERLINLNTSSIRRIIGLTKLGTPDDRWMPHNTYHERVKRVRRQGRLALLICDEHALCLEDTHWNGVRLE